MRTHREALTAGQVTAFGSAPSTSSHGIEVTAADELIYWHITGATAGAFYYYDGVSWRLGKTFTVADDGLVLAQAATGARVALHITAGTLTAGVYERHRGAGRL